MTQNPEQTGPDAQPDAPGLEVLEEPCAERGPVFRERVVVRAPGKVNLSLGVGAIDERGYHQLATVFHAVGLYETVTATRAADLRLDLTSHVLGEVPLDGSNLALRAAELLRETHGVTDGAHLHIDKEVPVAGGMGGGSADAAAALVALNRLWGLGIAPDELRRLGARLGADVPFAMLGHTALGRGNGGDLSSVLTSGDWHWVLAVPGGHLSTPVVFRRADELLLEHGRTVPAVPEPDAVQLQALRSGDVHLLGQTLHNDLQAAAFSLHDGLEPVIAHAERHGAWGALVSGSGPTIAVLAQDAEHAAELRDELLASGLVLECHLAQGSVPGARVVEEA